MLNLFLLNILYSFLILILNSIIVHILRENIRSTFSDSRLIDIIGVNDDESYLKTHGFLAYLFSCSVYIAFMAYGIIGLGILIYMGFIWGRK